MSIQTSPQFVAELTVYDRSIATTRVLRYAVKGLVTKPAETPANTFFDERVTQPIDIQRTMFASRATRGRSTTAYGQLVLSNLDGALDGLNEYRFDGRAITVRRTTTYNPSYPSDYTTILVGTMAGQPEFSLSEIRVMVRDRLYEVTSTPLQSNRYAGSNVLPAGLEGVPEDLGGKVKPVCFGTVKNVPAPCVNTSKLIYQVNDGAVNSVDAVYDRGVALVAGRKWTSAGVVDANGLLSLRGGNNIFAVGTLSNGKIYTSPDGVTWTLKQTFAAAAITGIAYGNSTWIAISQVPGTTTARVSTDNFGSVASHVIAGSPDVDDLIYHESAGLFIAGTSTGSIYTSPDGTTWTLRFTVGGGLSLFLSGAYGEGVAVFVGNDGSGAGIVYSSLDGISWASRVGTAIDTSFGAVAYGNGVFVATGTHTTLTSDDGFTWTVVQQSSTTVFAASALVYSGLFISAGLSTPLRTSADGLNWFDATSTLGGVTPQLFTANDFLIVATVSGGGVYYTQIRQYSTSVELLDDTAAPMAGEFIPYLSGGYFRLGSTPDGVITSDVTQGAASADRTTAQLANLVLARLTSAPSFDASDVTALDLAASAVNGYWSIEDGVTCANVLDFLVGTPGASWFVGNDGSFHLKQLTAPSGTPDLTVVADDLTKLERVSSSDDGGGVPPWKIQVRWGKYYQTITSDIAGAVTDEDRAQFAQEWRDVTSSDATILTEHPSSQVLVIESAFSAASDAQTESDRQLALRGTKRDLYDLTMALNDQTALIDINNVIEVIHPRFSLSVVGSPSGALLGGGLFRVLDVRPDAKNARVTFTVWGRSRYKNGDTDTGILMATSTGAYGVASQAA